jgi:ubiquinone/menaquinone biosynthesis C-methylase UbiE
MTRALTAALLLIASFSAAQEPHHPEPEHRGHGGRGRYGNPADLDAYIAHLADPKRDAWQKPDELVAALGLRPGQTACDVGSGPGYFTLRLARAVGASGRVYAVDVEPQILDALRERLAAAKLRNVTPILALADDALLPPAACDVILIVDTYHHFPERTAYLRRLSAALSPGGRIVNVDYHKRPTPVGPPMDHRLSREEFLSEAKAAGLAVMTEPEILPYQYVVVLRPLRRAVE